ncbi:uncharacterized protein LOC112225708 isoform X3 [Oncorhynchus tshawytscha]|uniref:uncharacterized protein LOC112225708 isoform X3 n=1 Tax=Oncorhynchus tshawytscha TaxID=74940 RepID=UPI001C3C7218|nr:uncharacterized protein LOC112225708 isoform X3 [Oncorhynchus tshawytscha]
MTIPIISGMWNLTCTPCTVSASVKVIGYAECVKMTVLANDKEMKTENRTLAQTSHSITILGCLDRLTYSMDCTLTVAPFWEVLCLTNCSHGPYKPATNLHSNDHVPINQELDYCQVYSCSSPLVFDIAGILTTCPGIHHYAHLGSIITHTWDPSLRTPGIHHYAHLATIIMRTCRSS